MSAALPSQQETLQTDMASHVPANARQMKLNKCFAYLLLSSIYLLPLKK